MIVRMLRHWAGKAKKKIMLLLIGLMIESSVWFPIFLVLCVINRINHETPESVIVFFFYSTVSPFY